MTIKLELNGRPINADIISFERRLQFADDLIYEDECEGWAILRIKNTSKYVAYEEAF